MAESAPFPTDERLSRVLAAFRLGRSIDSVRQLHGGHIHRTLHVVTDTADVVAQTVNEHVFRDVEACEHNLSRIDVHFRHPNAPIGVPAFRRSYDDRVHWRDTEGDGVVWRVADFVHDTTSATGENTSPYEAARAFGCYVAHLATMPGGPLQETIPAFHDLPARARALDAAARHDRVSRVDEPESRALLDQARALLAYPGVGVDLRRLAQLPVHNDAKIANLRVDGHGAVRAVVDLDTTMPGSPLFDVGELVRSGVSDAPEDAEDPDMIVVDADRYEAIIAGFSDGAGTCLDSDVRALLPAAGPRMALENGIRFLTDYLDGDTYYNVAYGGQNLRRARAQLALCQRLLSLAGHR